MFSRLLGRLNQEPVMRQTLIHPEFRGPVAAPGRLPSSVAVVVAPPGRAGSAPSFVSDFSGGRLWGAALPDRCGALSPQPPDRGEVGR